MMKIVLILSIFAAVLTTTYGQSLILGANQYTDSAGLLALIICGASALTLARKQQTS